MAHVNIPRSRDDPNYRYKMPKLVCRVEGRGNGVKTNVLNMGDIASSLKCPPMYPTKFMGCELGAQAQFSEAEGKAMVNGAHTEGTLDEVLDKFITLYVLCPGCGLPEIIMSVKKRELTFSCHACGHAGSLDSTHKAATYMMKNPPNASPAGGGSKIKEQRRALKVAKEKGQVLEEEEKKKIKKEKKKDEQVKQAKIVEEKDKKKKKKKDGEASDHELTVDSADIENVISRMQAFVLENADLTPSAFFTELRLLQVSQSFDAQCRIFVIFKTFLNNENFNTAIDNLIPYLEIALDESVSSKTLIIGLERAILTLNEQAQNQYPMFLHNLYSNYLLEANDLLKFFQKNIGDPTLKKNAAPFIQWLESLESDSEPETLEQSHNTKVLTKSLFNQAPKINTHLSLEDSQSLPDPCSDSSLHDDLSPKRIDEPSTPVKTLIIDNQEIDIEDI